MKPTTPLEKRITQLFKKWQKRLGLRDWDLSWKFATERFEENDLYERRADAITYYQSPEQRARTILVGADHYWNDIKDLERVIIHELVHVRLAQSTTALDLADKHLQGLLAPPQYAVLHTELHEAEEDIVRAITELLMEVK